MPQHSKKKRLKVGGIYLLFSPFLLYLAYVGYPSFSENAGQQAYRPDFNSISTIQRDAITGQYSWTVGGKPFYLRGVIYHTDRPVSGRRLRKDLSLIRQMGANAIVCQTGGFFDKRIFKEAEKNGLKVALRLNPGAGPSQRIEEDILALVSAFRSEKALLAFSLAHGPDSESTLSKIKGLAPNIPLIWECGEEGDAAHAPPFADLIGVDQRFPYDDTSLPYAVLGLGRQEMWDTFVSGMPWPPRYPEQSSFEKARNYSKLWKKLEEDRGRNLGGAVYSWSDHAATSGAQPGITDQKGRLKPAYYALKELWTGQSQSFPIQDLILKTEHVFHNGVDYIQVSSLSPNAPDPELTYEWRTAMETAPQISALLARTSASANSFLSRANRKILEESGGHFFPVGSGDAIRIRHRSIRPGQRIYLYVSDDKNNVVTASFPIEPGHIIQRIP